MKKNGIITIWTITLIVMLSYVMSGMSNFNSPTFWLSSMKEKELAYHHLITIEEWAKKQLKSGYRTPKQMKVDKDNLKVDALLVKSDGKININSLVGSLENNWKYSIFSQMFKWFYQKDPVPRLNYVLSKLEMDDTIGAINELGVLSEAFIDRKLISLSPGDTSVSNEYIKSPYFKEENMVNINSISPSLASLLLRMDLESATKFVEQQPIRNKDNLSDNPYPQFMQSFWKVDSLFYEVKGHIIVNKRKIDFVIHLNKEGGIVKTTKRKMF